MDLSKPYSKLALLFILVLSILFWFGFPMSILAILVIVWVVYSIELMESIEMKGKKSRVKQGLEED
jgi:5-bromo-4-chloroindolyl phosphate hydrolysis protein